MSAIQKSLQFGEDNDLGPITLQEEHPKHSADTQIANQSGSQASKEKDVDAEVKKVDLGVETTVGCTSPTPSSNTDSHTLLDASSSSQCTEEQGMPTEAAQTESEKNQTDNADELQETAPIVVEDKKASGNAVRPVPVDGNTNETKDSMTTEPTDLTKTSETSQTENYKDDKCEIDSLDDTNPDTAVETDRNEMSHETENPNGAQKPNQVEKFDEVEEPDEAEKSGEAGNPGESFFTLNHFFAEDVNEAEKAGTAEDSTTTEEESAVKEEEEAQTVEDPTATEEEDEAQSETEEVKEFMDPFRDDDA